MVLAKIPSGLPHARQDSAIRLPDDEMTGKRRIPVSLSILIAAVAALGIILFVIFLRNRPITLHGAVIRKSGDPNKEAPIAGVEIAATDGAIIATSKTDAAGAFRISLRRALIRRHSVTLSFRHAGYKPLDIFDPTGDRLYIARMIPIPIPTPTEPDHPAVRISNVSVRYTVKTQAVIEVEGAINTFDVVNKGDVPCKGNMPCSPDGKWKAAEKTLSLDAGEGNEFRNGRVSCIAGPCPFTAIAHDGFSKGGRTISARVLNWSDTTTFLMQAEAVRQVVSNTTRKSYPVTFDRTMNFSLPASADGTCIEADVDGAPIVFPIGPNLSVSWADCEAQTEPENSKLYRCELRPGYVFR
jgi:hypothetical protein